MQRTIIFYKAYDRNRPIVINKVKIIKHDYDNNDNPEYNINDHIIINGEYYRVINKIHDNDNIYLKTEWIDKKYLPFHKLINNYKNK